MKNCNHHCHKTCLQDIFTLRNVCPLCDVVILDGYEACLKEPKMQQNKVTRVMAAAKKKKKTTIDSNMNDALRRQAE